jgi:flagellar basal body-associated protein FliL|tara:strand:- start:1063 stop:1326 length:264 start_codon:yes stop_codon:yes gene_type:complete
MSSNYRTSGYENSSTILLLIVAAAIFFLVLLISSGTFFLNSGSKEDKCVAKGVKMNAIYAKTSSGQCYSSGCKEGYEYDDEGVCKKI